MPHRKLPHPTFKQTLLIVLRLNSRSISAIYVNVSHDQDQVLITAVRLT